MRAPTGMLSLQLLVSAKSTKRSAAAAAVGTAASDSGHVASPSGGAKKMKLNQLTFSSLTAAASGGGGGGGADPTASDAGDDVYDMFGSGESLPVPKLTPAATALPSRQLIAAAVTGATELFPPLVFMIAEYAAPFVSVVTRIPFLGQDELELRGAYPFNDEWCVLIGWYRFTKSRLRPGGESVHFCGLGSQPAAAFAPISLNGDSKTVPFHQCVAICRDPNPNRVGGWYVADKISIRYFDEATDRVTLIAGGLKHPPPFNPDGIGTDAHISDATSLIVSADGSTLWFTEFNSAVRQIDIATQQVTTVTVWGEVGCRGLIWDRNPRALRSESGLYLLALNGLRHQINRYDVGTRSLMRFSMPDHTPSALVSTATGHLIFRDEASNSLVVFDPTTLEMETIGLADADAPHLCLLEMRRMIVAAGAKLFTYTLPPKYFPPLKCCDRDL